MTSTVRFKVTGEAEIIEGLQKAVKSIEGHTRAGLQEAGLFVKGESMEITPQKTGFLLGTAFFSTDRGIGKGPGTGPRLRVGYTAAYAPFVHEMPETYKYTKPGTGPKFLEKAVKNSIPEILAILQDSVKVL